MDAVKPALSVERVSRRFGGVQALADVDFEVAAGELVGLIGPNGSGKSTLVNVVTRMIDADSGRVAVHGVDVTRIAPWLAADHGIARTYQRLRLCAELTMQENVAAGLLFRHQRGFGALVRLWAGVRGGRKAVLAAAGESLRLMAVPESAWDRLPREVPFSIQRRAEIARALAASPKVVLLDEPAAGMNPAEVAELAGLLVRANTEMRTAVVLIEHNMDLVMRVVQRVTVINRGQRIAVGTPAQIRNNADVVRAYLGSHGQAREAAVA